MKNDLEARVAKLEALVEELRNRREEQAVQKSVETVQALVDDKTAYVFRGADGDFLFALMECQPTQGKLLAAKWRETWDVLVASYPREKIIECLKALLHDQAKPWDLSDAVTGAGKRRRWYDGPAISDEALRIIGGDDEHAG